MPVTPTYPGVYIEEIPSGVRTITGVATSITAFIGWAPKGPTNQAQLILSFSDYERQFGGLNFDSPMSYAVSQFFANGGQQGYVVRLAAPDSVTATAALNGLSVTAAGPGVWANNYKIRTKRRTEPDDNRFRLEVVFDQDSANVTVEAFENLSLAADDTRSAVSVINSESTLITVKVTDPTQVPTDQTTALAGGLDGAVLRPDDAAFHDALNADGTNGEVGVHRLDRVDLFNLLCVPAETDHATLANLQKFCRDRRAFLIADSEETATFDTLKATASLDGLTGKDSLNAAFYFPWILAPDPRQAGRLRSFPPSGFVAGLYAQTDAQRGVWKAPAGTEASLTGANGVAATLTDLENGALNVRAINCIRTFPVFGTILWGARTLQGNDEVGSEWKYIPVRRTALFIEESLFRALKWVVFEPNDEPLWAQIRLNVGAFMHDLFRQGAFQGRTPRDAYFVKCDKETTTQSDINRGIVNIIVGFAPLKPAEFVIIKLQQMAGQIEV
ncbi:MAG TPA: phage tail sheath subtilisin-like domain-containing protein [Blastocatellia bacterium]|nr:phage tail sheath subtilisin-like domain-containing protein [Blastocatellia bacterium]